MITKISAVNPNFQAQPLRKTAQNTNAQSTMSTPAFGNYTATGLVNAYQAFHGIQTAKTVSFGKSLAAAFKDLNQPMTTCRDKEKGKAGESVGSRVSVTNLINDYYDELPNLFDAIKTDIEVSADEKKGTITDARTQLKRTPNGIMYENKTLIQGA